MAGSAHGALRCNLQFIPAIGHNLVYIVPAIPYGDVLAARLEIVFGNGAYQCTVLVENFYSYIGIFVEGVAEIGGILSLVGVG